MLSVGVPTLDTSEAYANRALARAKNEKISGEDDLVLSDADS